MPSRFVQNWYRAFMIFVQFCLRLWRSICWSPTEWVQQQMGPWVKHPLVEDEPSELHCGSTLW